jgi:hypothetical protein
MQWAYRNIAGWMAGAANLGSAASSGLLTIVADALDLSLTNLRGAGDLVIEPEYPESALGIGNDVSATIPFHLNATEIGKINVGGFARVFLGRSDGTGLATVKQVPGIGFASPTVIRCGSYQLDPGTSLSNVTFDITGGTDVVYGTVGNGVGPMDFDLTISTGATANVSQVNGVFIPTGTGAVVQTTDILSRLNAGLPVVLRGKNITLGAALTKSTGPDASLTLEARDTINLSANMKIASTSGRLDVALNSDRDEWMGGRISVQAGAGVTSLGGNIILGGGINPLQGYAAGTAAGRTRPAKPFSLSTRKPFRSTLMSPSKRSHNPDLRRAVASANAPMAR